MYNYVIRCIYIFLHVQLYIHERSIFMANIFYISILYKRRVTKFDMMTYNLYL